MKVLAKIGLIAAAAAVVLFIFVYEVYKPAGANQVMTAPPDDEESPYSYYNGDLITEATTDEAAAEEEPSTAIPETTDLEQAPPNEQPEEVNEELVEEEVPESVATPTVDAATPPAEVNVRRIYGKITLASTGEKVAGVNIMIPGSNVAKISNNIGGYTIQVPQGTEELVFIYRGKKLVQRLSSNNNLLNVRLNLETMQYD